MFTMVVTNCGVFVVELKKSIMSMNFFVMVNHALILIVS